MQGNSVLSWAMDHTHTTEGQSSLDDLLDSYNHHNPNNQLTKTELEYYLKVMLDFEVQNEVVLNVRLNSTEIHWKTR